MVFADGYDVVAVEQSSFQLHWSRDLAVPAGALLNLADDHLEWHGTFDAYAHAKEAIWRAATAEAGGTAVGNLDDPRVTALLAKVTGRRVGFTLGTPDTLAPLVELYKKNIEKAEPVGGYVNNNIMVTGDMLCLEDGDRARQVFMNNRSNYHTGLVFKYLDSFPRPEGFPVWPDLPPDPTMEELKAGANAAASCVGDPDEIARTIQKFIDIGADQLTFSSTVCDYDMDTLRESYETFGKHLIPKFDTDPVHSTTRQREAQCGACNVLLDGNPVPSCDTPLWSVPGHEITTIEGIGGPDAGGLHPVQQAFIDEQAIQCGYCIDGIIISAVALLRRESDPSDAQIAAALDRNLCRCGTHVRILRAIRAAARAMQRHTKT